MDKYIKIFNGSDYNRTKDARGCYKKGDIVVVMEDGHRWGKKEGPPNFVIVKIPGVSVEAARKYIEAHTDTADPLNPVALARRKYTIRVDDMPASAKEQIAKKGEVTVTWSWIKGFVRNKATGLDVG